MKIKFNTALIISEVLLVCLLLFRLVFYGIIAPEVPFIEALKGVGVATVIFVPLVYVAVYDLYYFEIPNRTSLIVLVSLVILNVVAYLIVSPIGPGGIANVAAVVVRPIENMQLALIMGVISFLIVYLTKEKLMGEGDIRMFLIAGLIVGMGHVLSFLYIMSFSGLIYGAVVGLKRKKLSGVKIPLGTFIVLSAVITFLLIS